MEREYWFSRVESLLSFQINILENFTGIVISVMKNEHIGYDIIVMSTSDDLENIDKLYEGLFKEDSK